MTPGSIVWFKDFTFHDGEQSDKYLIVMNDGNKRPYVVLKTTSRKKHRLDRDGCHSSKGYYFIPANVAWFREPTWVLFDDPYELDAILFLKAKFSGKADIRDCLKPDMVRALINCFEKSDDCSDHLLSLMK